MNAYQEALRVEAQGIRDLLPLLSQKGYHQLKAVPHGYGNQEIARLAGDYEVQNAAGSYLTVDVKVEQEWTGNLFLETWSNLFHRPGWLYTSHASLIFYYFIDRRVNYSLSLHSLRKWCFDERFANRHGRIFNYQLKKPRADQPNETRGAPVPIRHLAADIPVQASHIDGNGDVWECDLQDNKCEFDF